MNHLNDKEVKELLFGLIEQMKIDEGISVSKKIDRFIDYLKDQEIYLSRSTENTGFQYINNKNSKKCNNCEHIFDVKTNNITPFDPPKRKSYADLGEKPSFRDLYGRY